MTLEARLATVADEITKPNRVIETELVPLSAEGSKIIVSGVVLIVLTAIWTCMRLWSVRQSSRAFFIDDGLNLAAVALFYGLVATDFVMVLSGGMGYHLDELQDWHIVRLMQALYAHQFLYATSLGLVKISIVLMFMRMFFGRRFHVAALGVMSFSIAWMILAMIIELLICHPINMAWDSNVLGDKCGDRVSASLSVGIIDIINELFIIMLPIPMVWKMQTEKRYLVAIVCIYAIGIATMLFSAAHLYTVIRIEPTDIPYTAVPTTIYSTVEVATAIIVSSSPLLKPVFDTIFGGGFCTWMFPQSSVWGEENGELSLSSISKNSRRHTMRSGGFTQMDESHEDLELGNMGAHRSKRNTTITVNNRMPEDDTVPVPELNTCEDYAANGIVVTSETIIRRDKGQL
ncbi:hypothetical protein F4779DRAFT_605203 [Xylariaceae sp. FL0662B]|nr:hypothetical protein F4779DRAFT_605203 [Xylariaceae sp. FL0662B]